MTDHLDDAVEEIIATAARKHAELGRPVVVALDGGAGSGKSTLAGRLASLGDVAVVPLDDLYQTVVPEAELGRLTAIEKLDIVWDWQRVRADVLEPLRASRPARWCAFDFTSGLTQAGTYRLGSVVTEVPPAPIIVLDGAYSASPPLADLIDIAVLVEVPTDIRHGRMIGRGDGAEFLSTWHPIWDEVETHYFSNVRPPSAFDIVIRTS